MAVPLETVVKQLEDSGIVAAGKLENFVPPKAHPQSVDDLVAELVKADHLTTFQAQHVKAGKSKSLILGGYTILDKIGAGGMGQVFKAQHRRMKRVVAIKMLPPAVMKDAAAAARFQREVEAAAKLEHPNIVTAYDADQANGVHFLVMQFVDGQDLSALVKKNGPFPIAKAVNYVLQAAKGLEFAHSEGVVHRDIKPANLLLDKKGTVKILDMGLARIESPGEAQAELTGTGAVMGTVDYMSPEQAFNTKHADARADIYSLGCSLYYLVAGKATYGGETVVEKIFAHKEKPIPALRDVQPTVPEELETVFKKMVAKKIEDRYQTMTEVVGALEKCQAGLSAAAASSTSVWQSSTVPEESDMSIAFAAGRIPSIPSSAEEPLPTARIKKPRTVGKQGPPGKKTKLLIGAGAGGGLALLLGVIVIFRNQQGDEVGRMELPDGTSVEVRSTTPPAPSTAVASSVPAISTAPPLAKAPFDAAQAKAHQAAWAKHLGVPVEYENSLGMKFVLIPPGEFLMGVDPMEVDFDKLKIDGKDRSGFAGVLTAASPRHPVTITRPFYLQTGEVTIGQYQALVGKLPQGNDPTKPNSTLGAYVTLADGVAFCDALSKREGKTLAYQTEAGVTKRVLSADGYRLPTEAEWEHACRAGTTTPWFFGDNPHGPKGGSEVLLEYQTGSLQPLPAKPNPFGLYFMYGGTIELCYDLRSPYRSEAVVDPFTEPGDGRGVVRGGSGNSSSGRDVASVNSFARAPGPRNTSDAKWNGLGRVLLPIPDGAVAAAGSRLATATAITQPNHPWNTPAFQAWVTEVQAMPAEKQIESVSKKLMELNPGFDGKIGGLGGKGPPKVENGVVTLLGFQINNVTDLSPVRALAGLKSLGLFGSSAGNGKLSDLGPLEGMALTYFACSNSKVSELLPLKGMALTYFACSNNKVSDLLPLKGMPLTRVICSNVEVSDLSPLEDCKSLATLDVTKTKVTPATVAALQEALPNCKINWDDPAVSSPQPSPVKGEGAAPKTPGPAASGTK